MLPREFLDRFGHPTIQRRSLGAGETWEIPADFDRYLLVVGFMTQSVNVRPLVGAGETVDAIVVGNSPQLWLRLSHAIDGSMVNMGWVITASPAASDVTVIQGFMRGTGTFNTRGHADGNSQYQNHDLYRDGKRR